MGNYLIDKEFLRQVDEHAEKELWAKIIALNINEEPIEEISGRIKEGGSISVDGISSLRRSCSVSIVAQNLEVNSFYWGLNTKFKLYIGLTNKVNTKKYNDILWFNQGTFVITSFNFSRNMTEHIISIQGKDKMCLLNGEVSGTINAPIDFGKIEETDEKGNVKITSLKIKDIIWEAVHEYGKELWKNIIIEDLDDLGVELMTYKGTKPLYICVDKNDEATQLITLNGKQKAYYLDENGKKVSKNFDDFKSTELNNRNKLINEEENTSMLKFYLQENFNENTKWFTLMKIAYGETPGYRLTDITYAGDLVANPGESLTSVLDKIVKMLGIFEYFYDLDGRFIFRKKKIYIDLPWNGIDKNGIVDVRKEDPIFYRFTNGQLVSNFSNNPLLDNLKNDYTIWGRRKSAVGAEIPIHYRYAIDKKPYYYKNYEGKIYSTESALVNKTTDWREIIYQMALDYRKHNHDDDFLVKIINNNMLNGEPVYPTGYTGYEQYYIDMEGFWRQLYNPNYMTDDPSIGGDGIQYEEIEAEYVNRDEKQSYYMNPLIKIEKQESVEKMPAIPEDCFIFIKVDKDSDSNLPFNEYIQKFTLSSTCNLNPDIIYYEKNFKNEFQEVIKDFLHKKAITTLYIKMTINGIEQYVRWVDYQLFNEVNKKDKDKTKIDVYYIDEHQHVSIDDAPNKEHFYKESTKKYYNYLMYREYKPTEGEAGSAGYIYGHRQLHYFIATYNYYEEGEPHEYWNKNVYENPQLLNFWIDFMSVYGEMGKYASSTIGVRPKVINDNMVKSIYFRETSNIVFFTKQNGDDGKWGHTEQKSGYTFIQLPSSMLSLFNISSQGKSAKTVLDENLYKHTYCAESINLNTIPIYYFEPNVRIYVKDMNSGIDGEYIVNRFSYPLSLNGTMSVSANKVVDSVI